MTRLWPKDRPSPGQFAHTSSTTKIRVVTRTTLRALHAPFQTAPRHALAIRKAMAMVVAIMDVPVIAVATELALKSLWRESIVQDASGSAVELGSIQAKLALTRAMAHGCS